MASIESRLVSHGIRSNSFLCSYPNCERAEGFKSKIDLDKHKRLEHDIPSYHHSKRRWQCQACPPDGNTRDNTRIWVRLDNFKDHCRKIHRNHDLKDLVARSELQGTELPFARYHSPFDVLSQHQTSKQTRSFDISTCSSSELSYLTAGSPAFSIDSISEIEHLSQDPWMETKQGTFGSSKASPYFLTGSDSVLRSLEPNKLEDQYPQISPFSPSNLSHVVSYRASPQSRVHLLHRSDSGPIRKRRKTSPASIHASELTLLSSSKPGHLPHNGRREEVPLNSGEKIAVARYLEYIFEHICCNLLPYVPKDRSRSDIVSILSKAIELGALKSTQHAHGETFQRLWALFSTNSRIVAENVEKRLALRQTGKDQQEYHDMPAMSIKEKLDFWDGHEGHPFSFDNLTGLSYGMDLQMMRTSDDLRFALLDHTIHLDNDPCLSWSIKAAKRDLSNSCPTSTIMNAIAEEVFSVDKQSTTIELATLTTAPSSGILKIGVTVYWNLAEYIHHQAAGLRAKGVDDTTILSIERLGQAITLTGSVTDAEALTCFEYLDRIWPESGRTVLGLIQTAFKNYRYGLCSLPCPIPGIEKLELIFYAYELTATIDGEPSSIVEILQILTWLSSAFRISDTDDGVMICHPSFHLSKQLKSNWAFRPLYRIDHRLERLEKQKSGQCWYSMLRNPIVVSRFPIRYRSQAHLDTGLEVSLPIIASLIQSTKIIVLDGRLFLKGFSSMLVPTTLDSEIVRWHYLFRGDGDYLPFDTANSCAMVALDSGSIDNLRHVVGWCSEAKINAGAPNSCYTISPSHLEKTASSIVFKSFSLSAGQFVSLGTSIVLGVKDPPVHVSPVGLGIIDKFQWMEERYVVLWDSRDCRGWLVDGISALLHLLRASLKASQRSRFFKSFKLKEADIYEPESSYPQAACDFFIDNDHQNLKLELYLRRLEVVNEMITGDDSTNSSKTRTTSVLMQDLVERLWEILAHIITQQTEAVKREGCYWKPHLRESLEGWDFMNLACHQSPFEPIVAKMDCFSEPWVHFVRSINAVVLFGEGFGELIEPTGESLVGVCSKWKTLPKDKNYLATTFSTLEQIQRRYGREMTSPMEISKGFVWYKPSDQIAPCICAQEKDKDKHTDLVQVVWPSILSTRTQPALATTAISRGLKGNAALVFGQNQNFRWWQNAAGRLLRGMPPSGRTLLNNLSSRSAKRKGVTEDTNEGTDSTTTPESSVSMNSSQLSQDTTAPTTTSEVASLNSSKRARVSSIVRGLSARPRSDS